MSRRIDARDLLDPNARTTQPFDGRLLGYFRRLGPNSWDPYELVEEERGTIRVLPAVKVFVEARGAILRMRYRRRVVRVRWCPTSEQQSHRRSTGQTPRDYLLEHLVEGYQSRPGFGLAAVLASKLKRKRKVSS